MDITVEIRQRYYADASVDTKERGEGAEGDIVFLVCKDVEDVLEAFQR